MALNDTIPGAWPGTAVGPLTMNPIATARLMQRRNQLAAAAGNPIAPVGNVPAVRGAAQIPGQAVGPAAALRDRPPAVNRLRGLGIATQ